MTTKQPTELVSSGVEALVSHLRDDGIKKGQEEADRLLKNAKERAAAIVKSAEKEAQELLKKSKQDSKQFQRAIEEEIRVAARDTVLTVKENLVRQFSENFKKLVTQSLTHQDLIRAMLLEILGKTKQEGTLDDKQAKKILLPDTVISLEQLRSNPKDLKKGSLAELIISLNTEMLEKGITLGVSKDLKAGFKIQLVGKEVEVDLSDEAFTEFLLQHLQPRFRAFLEGLLE